jgi:hypothetical protein
MTETCVLFQGVVEYSLSLFFAKLVSYTFLYWLPLYIKSSSKFTSVMLFGFWQSCVCHWHNPPSPFFFLPSSKFFLNKTFRKPALLLSSDTEAPDLGYLLNWDVLSHTVMCFVKNLGDGQSIKKKELVSVSLQMLCHFFIYGVFRWFLQYMFL